MRTTPATRRKAAARSKTFEHALFVYTTVMSRPGAKTAVVDAGHKAASVDSGMPEPFGMSGVVYERPSDEHGVLAIEGSNNVRRHWGTRFILIPGHCDPTVNLHDWYICIRGMGTAEARVSKTSGQLQRAAPISNPGYRLDSGHDRTAITP